MPRKAPVRVTVVVRTCADCQRVGLDVRIDHDGRARCFAGIGCQGKADRARGAA